MREEEIVNAVNFLMGEKLKDVPLDQRLQFLQGKLTQEELVEVKKRFDKGIPKPAEIKHSDKAARRLESVDSHFSLMTAINIASLAVLTTIGVNYMMDNVKEKKDASLRDEIKDRMQTSLRDTSDRIRSIEQSMQQLVSKSNYFVASESL